MRSSKQTLHEGARAMRSVQTSSGSDQDHRPGRRALAAKAALAGLEVIVAVLIIGAPGALAASPCGASGQFSQSRATATCTYTAAGAEDTFTVPAGVGSLSVTAIGAPGAGSVPGNSGGLGAKVSNAALPVTPGAALWVDVGGSGAVGCALSGGAFDGAYGGWCDEAGGGSSALLTAPRASATITGNVLTDSRLLVAGGGGGGGGGSSGGDAGNPALTGAGAGGCVANGGAGGVGPIDGTDGGGGGGCPGDASYPAGAGTAAMGGTGAGALCDPVQAGGGGGGGGGWFGGGGGGCGGGAGGGGGGGASYGGAGPSGAISIATASSTDAPEVVITYVPPDATSTGLSCSPGTVPFGQSTTCTATVTDTAATPSTPGGSVSFASDTSGGTFSSQGSCTLTPTGTGGQSSCSMGYTPGQVGSGTHRITASYGGDTGTYGGGTGHATSSGGAIVTVNKASQTIAFVSSPPSPAVFGASYTPTVTGGASGNPVVLSVDSSSGPWVCSIRSGEVSFTGVGKCVIEANQTGNSDYEAAAERQSFTVVLAPSVQISSPGDGAHYAQGQVVIAGYGCQEGAEGPGLVSCTGTVADGQPLDAATLGVHSFTVTAVSKDGLTGALTMSYSVVASVPGAQPPPGGERPPVLSDVSQSHRRWREVGRAGRHEPPVGTTFAFTLSEPARVTFTFTETTSGRLVSGRCTAPTRGNHRRRACARTVAMGGVSVGGRAGRNTVAFKGVLPRRRLSAGRYAVALAAVDSAGQSSGEQRLGFTIVG